MNGLEMKYFILKPAGDSAYAKASVEAMLAYANAIEDENQELATDLRLWASTEETRRIKREKNISADYPNSAS